MGAAALEPRTFRDRTTAPLARLAATRTAGALILLALALAVVAPSMARGRLFPRPTPYVATMQHAASRLRAGELPQWNPHEHLGEPLTRDGRTALWYPATLVHLLLPPDRAWQVIAIAHLWLAGLGAWRLAGRYGLEPVPRLMTGAAYMLCGPIVLGLESAQANVLVWLPWAALAVERLSERVTAMRIVLASLVLTIQLLGGDLMASAALVLTCTLALLIRAFWIGPKRYAAAVVAGVFVLAIALAASAAQWMPALWPITSWRSAIAMLWDGTRGVAWGEGPFVGVATAPALFGSIPLALAVISVRFGRRPRAVWLWTVIGVILALVLIGFDVAMRWPRAAEVLRPIPSPRVLLAGVCLAMAVLAGFGIETIAAMPAERAARVRAALLWLAGGVAAIAGVVVAVQLRRSHDRATEILQGTRLMVGAAMWCAAALVVRSHELPQWRSRGWAWIALACAELLAFAIPSTRGIPLRQLADVSDVTTYLRTQGDVGRFMSASARVPPALGTWQSLDDAGGAGRGDARYEAWSDAAASAGGRKGSDVLRVAGVHYLIADHDAPALPPPWDVVHRSDALIVYADDAPLPRAWVAAEGRRVASPREAIESLAATTQPIDPRRVALLDDADVAPVDRALIASRSGYWSHRATDEAASDITYASPTSEEIRVHVRQGGGGWFVISDAFAPGWQATIQAAREPIVAAFGAFRAVQVPAGEVEVVLRYEAPGWRRAVLVSVAGGAVLVVLVVWSLLRSRRGR